MIGIYKITNPKGRVYIGQAWDIEKRWAVYRRFGCVNQHKILRSLKKYGVDKHKFEVVIECEKNQLNELERYYQELYNCIGEGGLNCLLAKSENEKSKFSDEVRLKMRNSQLGKKRHPDVIRKIADMKRGVKRPPHVIEKLRLANLGKKHSEESRKKMSESQKTRKLSQKTLDRLALNKRLREEKNIFDKLNKKPHGNKGKKRNTPISDETRHKKRMAMLGRKMPREGVLKSAASRTGLKRSTKTIERLREIGNDPKNIERIREMGRACKGKKLTPEHIKKVADKLRGRKRAPFSTETRKKISQNSASNTLVINIENGIFYDSVKQAAESIGMSNYLLNNRLCGHKKYNETLIRYA
jgi:group I intron endonuclease